MSCISILFPSIKTHAISHNKIVFPFFLIEQVDICVKRLGFKKSDIELFRLVPFTNEESVRESLNENIEVAVRIHNSNISMTTIESIIRQRDKFKEQLQKTNEALKTYLDELQKMRKYFVDLMNETSTEGIADKSATKAIRYKKLEEDNSRLRSLLKTQLENSENLRLETQHTVETLREEFNALIKV